MSLRVLGQYSQCPIQLRIVIVAVTGLLLNEFCLFYQRPHHFNIEPQKKLMRCPCFSWNIVFLCTTEMTHCLNRGSKDMHEEKCHVPVELTLEKPI